MKKFLTMLLFIFIANGCIAKSTTQHDYTGIEFDKKFKKVQEYRLVYEADDENGGGVYSDEIKIYKVNNKECVIVSRINGDSGIYGTERILYFYNSKFYSGYIQTYRYISHDGKSNVVKYIQSVDDKETQDALQKDFKSYLKKIDRNTLNRCS